MNPFRTILFLTTVLGLLFYPTQASAHRPVWEYQGDSTQIENLSTSFAFYRQIETRAQVDTYTFEARSGENFHAGINIPAVSGLENYGVSVALLGPGIPQVDQNAIPIGYPEGFGAIIFPTIVGEDFFEPFTQTNYWGRQNIDFTLPESGTYYLLVWNPENKFGKYVLDTGTQEVFSPADLVRFPLWWLQVKLYFGLSPILVAGPPAALVLFAVWRILRRTRLLAGLPQSQSA